MSILGQVAAIHLGTAAPTNTNLIWGQTDNNDPNTQQVVDFKVYSGGAWVKMDNVFQMLTSGAVPVGKNSVHGTHINPLTGNLNLNFTQEKPGTTNIIFHNAATRPAFNLTDVAFSAADFSYKLNSVNILVVTYVAVGYATLTNLTSNKAVAPLVDAATVAWDYYNGSNRKVTLDGNRSLLITNAQSGDYGSLTVKQDATTGGRTLTPAGTNVGWIQPATAVDAETLYTWLFDGTRFIWNSKEL